MAAKLIVAEPVCAAGLAEVAEIVTGTLLGGGVAGAVYVTEVLVGVLSVPAPVAGEIVQEAGLTPLFAGSFVTVAVICEELPAPTAPTDATTETMMGGTSMLTVIDFVGSDAAVAVIVTDKSLGGGVDGAL
jgi:hypothetical protein